MRFLDFVVRWATVCVLLVIAISAHRMARALEHIEEAIWLAPFLYEDEELDAVIEPISQKGRGDKYNRDCDSCLEIERLFQRVEALGGAVAELQSRLYNKTPLPYPVMPPLRPRVDAVAFSATTGALRASPLLQTGGDWCRDGCIDEFNGCVAMCKYGPPGAIDSCVNGCSQTLSACMNRCGT